MPNHMSLSCRAFFDRTWSGYVRPPVRTRIVSPMCGLVGFGIVRSLTSFAVPSFAMDTRVARLRVVFCFLWVLSGGQSLTYLFAPLGWSLAKESGEGL